MLAVDKNITYEDVIRIYVDAYAGNNSTGTGNINSPVASLANALDKAASVNSDENKKVEIVVNDGTYYIGSPVTVDETNHVTEELVISAAKGATPTFVNGIAFKISDAVKVEDSEITSRLVSEAAADHLYELDLAKKVKLENIPEVNLPGRYSYDISWATEAKNPTCEMFFDGKPMTIARYPNESEGYTTVSKVVNS